MDLVLEVDALEAVAGPLRFALPNVQLAPGGCAALFAPSGSGKSTLLRAVLDPSVRRAGSVRLAGEDLGPLAPADLRLRLRTRVAFVAQDAMGALDPLRTVREQVAAAAAVDPDRGDRELERFSAADEVAFGARLPHGISGGQAQRALFAVAALRRPHLVVADEPTANLDDASAARVAAAIDALRRDGAAVLLATHDPRLLAALAPAVYVRSDHAFVPGCPHLPPWPRCGPPPDPSVEPVLVAREVAVRIGGRDVLGGLDLDLRPGEVVAVLGSSGAGKSTLLRALCGRLPLARGSVRRPVPPAAVALVPQDAAGSLTPHRTLRSLVREVAVRDFEVDAEARGLGLDAEVLERTVRTASGGERRRAALLRAFAVAPAVLLLDEPTAALDRNTAVALVAAVLARTRRAATAVVVVTHDEGLAAAIAHRILRLADGRWQTR